MEFRTGYNEGKRDVARPGADAVLECKDDSRTIQSQAKDADINVIMERFAKTGQLPQLARLPTYGDFDGISDFREAVHAVREAEDLFMQLPAKVRSRFENDPEAFVEYCQDPANRLELANEGLLKPEVADAIRKEAAEVKENPTGGNAGEGGAAGVAGRQPGRPVSGQPSRRSVSRDAPEGGEDH